ncbi:MAG: Asp23/Gls24 family envelope stress response protein [Lachnospiraceae bacterium]|nr:Asp23/Gls24 family envelope stress response protein [Lachnospiraceae bacterium]
MANEERSSIAMEKDSGLGKVQIADEVVAIIAALAASDVEGVASMAGYVRSDFVNKIGMRSLSKGVKVDVLDGVATVILSLNLKYNYSIVDVSEKVQEKVKATIENMTGLEVADVNIKVSGVEMESHG